MTLLTRDKVRRLTEFCIGLSFSERWHRACEHSSPACSRTDTSVQNLTRITDGWECDVYSFDLVTPSTVAPLILRLYMDKPESLATIKCQRELGVMKYLYNIGYPVPEIFGCQTNSACLGAPFLIMERICGPNLAQVYSRGNEDKKQAALDVLSSLLVKLHNLDPAEFDPETASLSTGFILQRELSEFEKYGLFIDDNIFGPALSWLLANMREVKPSRPSIIHYDFHAQNILVRDASKKNYRAFCVNDEDCHHTSKWQNNVLVIDWTQSRISDFRFDLAWSLLLMEDNQGQEMLKSYISKASMSNDSQQRFYSENTLGRNVASLDYFIAFACVRRLASIYGSIKFGADRFGMRPGAEEIMRKQTKHMRRLSNILTSKSGIELPKLEGWIAQIK